MANGLKEWERWLQRSKTTLLAAEALLDKRLLADAISRIYYAMFYTTKALFIRDGFTVKKHASVLSLFGREYVQTKVIPPEFHQMLIRAFESRQKSDYDVYWEMTFDNVQAQFTAAKQFVTEIERVLNS
ncbi:MAG: HEPN domain-containing protein [Chloroflexi bacterium]|nr:HEPN domain-containing protein [Chloroflexota bacterium]